MEEYLAVIIHLLFTCLRIVQLISPYPAHHLKGMLRVTVLGKETLDVRCSADSLSSKSILSEVF